MLWAGLISSVYVPSLRTRFDFIDDGNLVYPSSPMPLRDRLDFAWQKVVANSEGLGPFRPVLWAHWELQAELFHASAWRWRLARIVWATLAAAAMLRLLLTLGIGPRAALFATALAMWNPWRNEIWRSLTLSEGVAMPYALTTLLCAPRAARSSRPWAWDIGGGLCMLAALGCKNTFAAVVPAQLLLRVAPTGHDILAGCRRHGWRAAALSLTLIMPVVHYIVFVRAWHPGQYETVAPSVAQLGRMLKAVGGAVSIDIIGPGLLLGLVALSVRRHPATRDDAARAFEFAECSAALLTGAVLMACGIGIYLFIPGVSGRYTMPAVWGADLWIAALLSGLSIAPRSAWRRTAYAVLGVGLIAVAAESLGSQDKFAARANLLWQAVEFVESTASHGDTIAWMGGPDLNVEEGIHFSWHLHGRGREDLSVQLLDAEGRTVSRPEVQLTTHSPNFLITGAAAPQPGTEWHLLRRFTASYWGGWRTQSCNVWGSNLVTSPEMHVFSMRTTAAYPRSSPDLSPPGTGGTEALRMTRPAVSSPPSTISAPWRSAPRCSVPVDTASGGRRSAETVLDH